MSKSTCNNFLIYLLFAITILAVIQLIISPFITKLKNREAFQSEIRNEPILKAQLTYEYKPVITIYRRERDNSQKLDALDQSHNNVKIETINNLTELQRLKHPQHLFYTDAFTYNQKYRNFPILTICSSPKQFMLVSNKDQPLLVENNRAILNIGYRTETELELFKKIVKSQNDYVNMNGYKFVELKGNSNNEVITRLFDDKTIDILIVFATISDPLLVKVRERDYTLIAYNDNIDNNVLKYYIPFSKKRIVSNSRNREEESVDSDNNLIFYNTLLIDNLLVITDLEKAEKNSDIRNVWQYLLEYFDEFTKINYYQQFFQFASLSKNWSLKRQETASFQNIFDKPKFVEQNINKNVEHFASTPIKDSRISGTRDGLGLLNFDNSPSSKFMKFKVFPSKVVPLEHTNDLVKFKFEETIINGVPIKVGDKLYTETGLGNFFERTNYYVIEVHDSERGEDSEENKEFVIMENAIRLQLTKDEWESRERREEFSYIPVKDAWIIDNNIERDDRVYLTLLGGKQDEPLIEGKLAEIVDKNEEDKIMERDFKKEEENPYPKYNPKIQEVKKPQLLIRIPEESLEVQEAKKKRDRFEPEFRCYQDPTILTRNECLDTTDIAGRPKPSYNWDRPCVKDTECPFYLANKTYPNGRGGCNNGFCEFPIGLKRKSYREYDRNIRDNNYPRCYGCENSEDVMCCSKQKNPDYKFEHDQEKRRMARQLHE